MKLRVLSLAALASLLVPQVASARPGTVTFSDGKKLTGDLTLTPGTQLKIFTSGQPVELPLEETKELRFSSESEKMQQGFYFPEAGQATQAKTDDIYPIRNIHTQITLPDGHVLEGHLFTTVLYVQDAQGAAKKVVLEAKQTGQDNEKLTDLVYPTDITFTDAGGGTTHLDLSHETFTNAQPPVVISIPDLTPVALEAGTTPQIWSMPAPDPSKLFLSVQDLNGFHVGWPAQDADPSLVAAVQVGLHNMQDFYDTRQLIGTSADPNGEDIYTLVMMSRKGASYGMDTSIIPWSLVVLHWNYDTDTNKANLVNRAPLGIGRATNGSPTPPVLKNPALLNDISGPLPAAQ
jgi:hypothetical protein